MRWVALSLALAAGCASSDQTADVRRCWDLTQASADPQLRLRECMWAIESDLLTDEGLAQAYTNRGLAYYDLEDFNRATAEYDTAIRLAPNYGMAYYNRGLSNVGKHQYDSAIADFSAALD